LTVPVVEAIGSVYLTPVPPTEGETLRMTSDPDGVTDDWLARKSTQTGLGGVVTTQDFGRFAADCTRTLVWNRQVLDRDVIRQLDAWYGSPGSTLRYLDGEDNDWTVEIMAVVPERVFGQPRLYTCRLVLHVLAMTTLRGEGYLGP
jgi:hypothetical protein